ncbi:MAG TPA: helix-turn-helix domain-containing protein [Nitrososphaeraceae archaeon]|nr:helix-turn-helix domain-containing protein [Nitrososphaeraceae archaeon]
MQLILNVVYEKQIPAQVAIDLHRSKTWASDWFKRYRDEGIVGLRNKLKSGRPPDIL